MSNLDELKIGELKQLLCLLNVNDRGPFRVGDRRLIRTVTNYWTGRIVAIHQNELVIEEAAWIADTGRFTDAFKNGTFNEQEPIEGPVVIGRGSIVDSQLWAHKLPSEQK